MNGSLRLAPAVVVGVLALALAGCASGPKLESRAAAPTAVAPGDIEAIAALLDRGALAEARTRLAAALKGDPMNASLQVLRRGIEGDAKADLGPANYPYTVAQGDTMASLAQRFLGNRLKSYQLARYNDMDNPADLAPGQVLRIPGQRRAEPAPRANSAPPPPRASRPAPVAPPRPPRAERRPTPAAPVAAADPQGAARARAAGLAALNRGDVANAVAMLQRASALDPGNAGIKADLERARRIAGTVQSRR